MKIKLDLYHPYELEAFAVFTKVCADGKAAYDAAQPKDALFDLEKYVGGISRDPNFQWKTVGATVTETAEAPDASHIEPAAPVAPAEKSKRTRKKTEAAPASSVPSDDKQTDIEDAIAQQAAISTGDERIGPEDSPETIAQDAADEKAETDAARDPANPLTLDDLRNAMGAYGTAFGMDAALADGPAIFNKALGPIPEGTKNARGEVVTEWCLTATPTDQASLGKAVTYWNGALKENPFKRSQVAA